MYKFKIEILHNGEFFIFCTETELLNFKITLAFFKLEVSKLVSNGLILSGDTPVNIELVTF